MAQKKQAKVIAKEPAKIITKEPARIVTKEPVKVIAKEPIDKKADVMFGKDNFIWMLGGAAVIALGFILMAGGRSDDPNVFNKDEVYSTTRITIAPILILLGLVIEIFAIFRKPKG